MTASSVRPLRRFAWRDAAWVAALSSAGSIARLAAAGDGLGGFVPVLLVVFGLSVACGRLDRPGGRTVAGAVGLLVALAAATTSDRMSAVVGVGSVLVLTAGARGARVPRAGRTPNPSVVLVVAASQLVWALGASAWVTLGVLAVAAGLIELERASPEVAARLGDPLERIVVAAGGTWSARPSARDLAAAWGRRARPLRWIDRSGVGTGVLVAVIMFPAFQRLTLLPTNQISGFNDLYGYLEIIDQLSLSPFRVPPHLLYFVSARALSGVVGVPVASSVVLSLCAGLGAAVLVRLGRRAPGCDGVLPGRAAVAFALFVTLSESPTALFVALRWVPDGVNFAAVHLWASPTEVVGAAFALLLMATLLGVIQRPEPRSGDLGMLLVATVLSNLAKPSFALVLVGALPIYLWVARRATRARVTTVVLGCIAPTLAIFVLQSIVMVALVPPEVRSGLELAPLEALPTLGIGRGGPIYFFGALVFVLCGWSGGRRYVSDTGVAISAIALLLALVPMLLLRETGDNGRNAGNVAKFATMCWFVLYAFSVRFLFVEIGRRMAVGWRAATWPDRVWLGAAVAFVVLSLSAGAVVYLDAVGVVDLPDPARGGLI